jgi:hypothetical protein
MNKIIFGKKLLFTLDCSDCTVLYCTTLHCTAMQCNAMQCTVLPFTVLYCFALYCFALYWYIRYCIVWCCRNHYRTLWLNVMWCCTCRLQYVYKVYACWYVLPFKAMLHEAIFADFWHRAVLSEKYSQCQGSYMSERVRFKDFSRAFKTMLFHVSANSSTKYWREGVRNQ